MTEFGPFAASKWLSLLLSFSFLWSFVDAGVICNDYRALLTSPVHAWADDTIISFSNSTEFFGATDRWTIFRPPTYFAAISPATEKDVKKAVKFATSCHIPFLATGNRHGYSTTLGDLQNGLAIDLSGFKNIDIDVASETVTIGPGVTAGDIFDPLYEAGFELQTGSASCPSLIGVMLGGGVGRFTGIHGLLLDALVSVRLVTSHGELIEVSKHSHPDLFWAIRGAGANFGVITSATFKLHRLRNNGDVLNADLFFPAEKASDYFRAVEAMNGKLPAELASISLIMWDSSTNKTQVGANWVYLGPEDEGREALAPILALEPSRSEISVVKWNRLVATAGGGVEQQTCQDNVIRDLYSMNLKNYSASTYEAAFAKMADFFDKYPEGRSSILQFEFFPNQAMAAVPSGETAWPWRDATGYINPNMIWAQADSTTAEAAMRLGHELREDLRATSGYPEPAVFVNYARGDETLEQIYGKENLHRLASLKKKWDPNNFFSFNHALPTEYPPV
ncbi:hypothetical protein DL768_008400 [Monosporascus sp. mg162]|nr:hypothetical protein DL768_008400 [Monosporascus sp. mg162]